MIDKSIVKVWGDWVTVVSPTGRVLKHDGDVEVAEKCEIHTGWFGLKIWVANIFAIPQAAWFSQQRNSGSCNFNLLWCCGANLCYKFGCLTNQVAHNIAYGLEFISIGHNPSHISSFILSDVMD